jgi:DNA-binding response OmpR family regulator
MPRPTAAEAIDVLDQADIDVVVLDIMMPRVDGWMAIMEIRGNPATADVPIIMLTAKNQDLAKILAFKQGVQQYVTKPFNVLELSARVESLALGRRRLMGERSRTADSDFRKLAVRKGGRTILLSIDDIVFLSARNKSTYAHTYENQYLVDLTLGELEEKLGNESVHAGPPQLHDQPQQGPGDPAGRRRLRGHRGGPRRDAISRSHAARCVSRPRGGGI